MCTTRSHLQGVLGLLMAVSISVPLSLLLSCQATAVQEPVRTLPASSQSPTGRDYELEVYPIVAAEVADRCHIEGPIGTYVFSTATSDENIVRGWDTDQFRYRCDGIPPDLIATFRTLVADDVPQSDLSRIWSNVVMLKPSELGKYYFWHGPEWKAFRKKHPRPQGIWMFSRVGISRDNQWAMMYVVSMSGNCEDGTVYVLRRNGDSWVIDRLMGVWVA